MNLDLVFERAPTPVSDTAQRASRLQHYFEVQSDATPHATALICEGASVTYSELDARANRLAQYLLAKGIRSGDRVGILLDRSTETYLSLLAVLKVGAAYVPIDTACPLDRVQFIAADANLAALITTSAFASARLPVALNLEDEIEAVAAMPAERPEILSTGDPLAYIIYTSGTTGQPKGVAIHHSNICFFLNACRPVYRIAASDRVYQGMTLAFDFSIEELWPTWMAGATLVAGPQDERRIGSGLDDFLREHAITVLYCVPTLLATLDPDISNLRTLVVGGEACHQDLAERWMPRVHRMLNTYGPTETTVTASWTELEPGKPVTIGRPMPGYWIHILDEKLRPAAQDEPGEICIGGPGVARGYVNRPELTAAKFVPDPLEPGGKLYRSGDLGRFVASGEVEFLGRIDTQVKVRGFRIELGEIEAVLLEDPRIANAAVVAVGSPASDVAAFIILRSQFPGGPAFREELTRKLRLRLPEYMVPAFVEILDAMPNLASGKIDRDNLPFPSSPRIGARTGGPHVEPTTGLEARIAAAWCSIFGRDKISVDADFFLDLGGHSLFAARAVSQLRSEPALSHVSIADVYACPTIRRLAAHLESFEAGKTAARIPRLAHSNLRVWMAGLAQAALLYLVFAILAAPAAWLLARHGHSALGFNFWDLSIPASVLLLSLLLPVLLKWTLIGRFRPGTYPIWGWYYCRLWLVRKSIEWSPLHHMAGSPLLAVYARCLGARIGRDCHIGTAQLSLPDLIEIGEGASIGYDVELQPFVIESGSMVLRKIRIGAGAFVGTKSVVLAGAEIGERAHIAEQSLVERDARIPAGENWGGSPSRRCAPDPTFQAMDSRERPLGRPLWGGYLLGFLLLESLRILVALPGFLLLSTVYRSVGVSGFRVAIPGAGLLYVLTTCLLVWFGKRLVLRRALPGVYAANSFMGLRKWFVDQLLLNSLALTNTLYATLYTIPWLRALGASVGARSEVSTVSNLDPDLLELGCETFVADLASVGAAVFHNGYFALGRLRAGDRTFIGNAAVIRSGADLPKQCLIGVASVAPNQAAAEGSSWLGSPAIFLPKRETLENFSATLTYRPAASLMAYRLVIEFLRIVLPPTLLYALGTGLALASATMLGRFDLWTNVCLMPILYLVAAFGLVLLVAALKWAIAGRYRSRVEPLWAPFVRHTEFITGLYESVAVPALIGFSTGTPWAAPLLRLFGANIGRRVWLDSTYLTEFDLVRIGDDAAIGRATSLQTHLFEDRVMKMSAVEVGAAAEIGPRSVLLYDSHVQAGASLDGLSLVMKGESLPASRDWRGIPARLAP